MSGLEASGFALSGGAFLPRTQLSGGLTPGKKRGFRPLGEIGVRVAPRSAGLTEVELLTEPTGPSLSPGKPRWFHPLPLHCGGSALLEQNL